MTGPFVSTDWAAEHLDDPQVRFLQVDEDELLFAVGHIPGALPVRWDEDLQASTSRDVLDAASFARLMDRLCVIPSTTVVAYGDQSNLWASYACWALRLWGHPDVRLLDGGHARWVAEGRPLVPAGPDQPPAGISACPAPPRPSYPVPGRPAPGLRAGRAEVEAALLGGQSGPLVLDVRRSPGYEGEVPAGLGRPLSGAFRGGHIPGAVSLPWTWLVDPDTGCLRPVPQLEATFAAAGAQEDRPVIVYCEVGASSALVWLVLHDLLGHQDVANYDGSWLEWGSSIGLPVEP